MGENNEKVDQLTLPVLYVIKIILYVFVVIFLFNLCKIAKKVEEIAPSQDKPYIVEKLKLIFTLFLKTILKDI